MIERGNKIFDSMIEFAEFLKPLNMAFTELCKGVHIAITRPACTAGWERTCKLKLIKGSLHTTMEDHRLKSLTVISVHRQRALDIDMEDVVDKMVGRFPNMCLILV
jgi:hypothetical protein